MDNVLSPFPETLRILCKQSLRLKELPGLQAWVDGRWKMSQEWAEFHLALNEGYQYFIKKKTPDFLEVRLELRRYTYPPPRAQGQDNRESEGQAPKRNRLWARIYLNEEKKGKKDRSQLCIGHFSRGTRIFEKFKFFSTLYSQKVQSNPERKGKKKHL